MGREGGEGGREEGREGRRRGGEDGGRGRERAPSRSGAATPKSERKTFAHQDSSCITTTHTAFHV